MPNSFNISAFVLNHFGYEHSTYGLVFIRGDSKLEPKYRTPYALYNLYIYTKSAHWCYISSLRGGTVSQLIGMKFGTLIELTYLINFAKWGVERSQGWGLVSSQILGFCLYWRSRP